MSNFTAPLDIRSLPGGLVALLRPLRWYSDRGHPTEQVTVPLGFTCDGASIPRVAWPLIGHPLSSTVIRAGAVHDYLYHHRRINNRRISRARADLEFLDALRVDGVPRWRRWTMWAAVRCFAWPVWQRDPRTDRINQTIAAEVWRIRQALNVE